MKNRKKCKKTAKITKKSTKSLIYQGFKNKLKVKMLIYQGLWGE